MVRRLAVALALVASPAFAATPTIIQHGSSAYDSWLGTGIQENGFTWTLPNLVGAGNCIVLEVNFGWNTARTVTITDTNGTWSGTPAFTQNNGGDLFQSVFLLNNATAGTHKLTATFKDSGSNVDISPAQFNWTEVQNVDCSALNGSIGSTSTTPPSVATGSFTPTNNDANGGNLILAWFVQSSGATSNFPTAIVAGGSFGLLDADLAWHGTQGMGHFTQQFLQTTSAAINPGATVTMTPANEAWQGCAVALKAATQGTARPSQIYINAILHQTSIGPNIPASANWTIKFPSSGNLLVLSSTESSLLVVNSITDSKGNTWTKRTGGSGPQFWDTSAATTTSGQDLILTLHMGTASATNTIHLIDISGAKTSGSFDGSVENNPASTCCADLLAHNINDSPDFTPASQPGLVIARTSFGQGPARGFASGAPAGVFDFFVQSSGFSDSSLMDNADALGHIRNTSTSAETWNWVLQQVGSPSATNQPNAAVHYAEAPASTGALLRTLMGVGQ